MKPFLIVGLAALGLTTCACSSSSQAAQPAHTVTITAHPAAGRSVSATPIPSPSTSAAAARCQISHLNTTVGAPQGYRSGLQIVVMFKNTGTAACTLHGWPRVWQSTGPPVTNIGQPASEGPVPPPTVVTLPPNGTASARLQIEDSATYPTTNCKPVKATSLAVIPPGEKTATHISFGSTACKGSAKLMRVTTVVQGSGG
jgi:Protein of unknown function (DUF4232)